MSAQPFARSPRDLNTRHSLIWRLLDESTRPLAQTEIYEIYVPVIRGIALSKGVDRETAEDIAQDVIQETWRHFEKSPYDPQKSHGFRGFLQDVTAKRIWKIYRRAGLASQLGDKLDAPDSVDPADEVIDAFERAEHARLLEMATRRVQQSGVRQRTFEAWELVKRQGVPVPEVMARLGLAENTVHQYCKRVTDRIREEVERMQARIRRTGQDEAVHAD